MSKKALESRRLRTTIEVMDALGGIRGVAVLTGVEYGAAENWRRATTFPSRFFLVMSAALEKKRLTAPPELWGQVTPAERREAMERAAANQRQRMAS